MNKGFIKILSFLFVLCFNMLTVIAQEKLPWIYPNKGQWKKEFLFKTFLNQGEIAISSNAIHYNITELTHNHNKHNHNHSKRTISNQETNFGKGHYLKTSFLNSQTPTIELKKEFSEHYLNYFIGNKQASDIHGLKEVVFKNIYPNIDLEYLIINEGLKYQYKVRPNTSISCIKQEVQGAKSIHIDKQGRLHILHTLGEIIENKPEAFTIDSNGKKTNIDIQFSLIDNIISYSFPKGYNTNETLYIDPELIFSSFTGSTADNWGFTATYDSDENLYAGGITFGSGYPTNTGSYDIQYRGGEEFLIVQGTASMTIPGFDITISKFSKDGKKLEYTTYLGGKGNETPHSMIVNKYNELILFGATSSTDFPTTSGVFDNTFNGGVEFKNLDIIFSATDIFISKFSASGKNLLASTFLGGSGNDGINNGSLAYNYGDHFRGEINLTNNEEILIFTSTESTDIPLKSPIQNQLKGNIDGYLCKLSPNLDNLIFASYIGGENEDVGYGIEYSSVLNKIYISGGSNSSNFGLTGNVTKNSQHGGSADGYVGIINNYSHTIESFRFVGSQDYDQSFFVQIDLSDNVYVLSQTKGNFTISPNTYGNPNSGTLIQKYNADLTTILWQTTIGGESGDVEISPTAFMVSDCYEIYFTGWGGETNTNNSLAVNSSTNNFPITSDAIQSTTTGDNFYLCMLGKDASNLRYGSYFGGVGNNSYHVDGGTSRFSKKGGIYHAVCGACGGNPNGFYTTPGVWSETNKSPNCNLAAFKMELNKIKAQAEASDSVICSGGMIQFKNQSLQADTYTWDFGDNSAFNYEKEPSHIYQKSGEFKVKLIASDSKGCVVPDTTILTIKVAISKETIQNPIVYLCKDSTMTLIVPEVQSATYLWSTNSSTSNNLIYNIIPPTSISCFVKTGCSTLEYIFPFETLGNNNNFIADKTLCLGETIQLELTDIQTIHWGNHPEWSNQSTIQYTPNKSETIAYNFINKNGCSFADSVHIEVFTPNSKLINFTDTSICFGDSIKLYTEFLKNIQWGNISFVNQTKKYTYIKPYSLSNFSLTYEDACGPKREDFTIDIIYPRMPVSNDTIICIGDSILIRGSNMKKYDWWNYDFASIQSDPSTLKVAPNETTVYYLIGTDEHGCKTKEAITIHVYKRTPYNVTQLQQADWETPAILYVFGNGIKDVKWKPSLNLNCDSCFTVAASITQNTNYNLVITDKNTCKDSSIIYVKFIDNLYVPNAFYPNSKNGNENFKAIGTNIRSFEMQIFNRWGELITTLNELDESWDGTYKGIKCPNDVYVWKIKYTSILEEYKEIQGHVTLLR
jgi:gliding motility-associated-like protein